MEDPIKYLHVLVMHEVEIVVHKSLNVGRNLWIRLQWHVFESTCARGVP